MKAKHEARTATALVIAAFFGLQAFAEPRTSLDIWKSMMSEAQAAETNHESKIAIQTYAQAASYAEKTSLPAHCSDTSLCRKTAAEVRAGLIPQANADCDKLMSHVAKELAIKALDPDLEVWIQDLANAYQSNTNPQTREQCLLKLSQINKVLYGEKNQEYKNSRAALGKFYSQSGQSSQARKAAEIQISTDEDGIKQAERDKDTFKKGFYLNDLALKCRLTGRLSRAKEANLELVKMAKQYPAIADGLVNYYSGLGTIELAQGNFAEGQSYFSKAITECQKLRGSKIKVTLAVASLNVLVEAVKSDKSPYVADSLKQLLAIQQALSTDPQLQYSIVRALAEVLSAESKSDEACKYFMQAISIAQRQKGYAKELSDLWMHVGLIRDSQLKSVEANEAFANAINAESDKVGFNATKILLIWGGMSFQHNNPKFAYEKLSLAAKQAEALPKATRGTLLIDSLYAMCQINILEKNLKANSANMAKLIPEIKEQQALNTNLGPNFWGKFQHDKFSW
ncbi:MAG TPA: hypothetical protein V6C86_22040 [Oculatellaceae cyanobacterium]